MSEKPEFDVNDEWLEGMQFPAKLVLAWGMRRRAYDLAHPMGEHEAEDYSSRPAFLDDLLPPLPPPTTHANRRKRRTLAYNPCKVQV